MIFNACKQNISETTVPEAVNGILDLRKWDFENKGPAALSGQWAFYWHSLLQPDDFASENPPVASGFIEVPADWNGFEVNGKKIAGDGYATYRLKILLDKTSERLAFKFLDMAGAFSVWVNGNRLTSSGVPGKTFDTTLTDTLILDEDGIYDPTNFNDRLLLNMKGTFSEVELHVLKSRLRGGALNKARRGEFKTRLPTGFVYDHNDKVILDPDKQVQQTFRLFFDIFKRAGSAFSAVKAFGKGRVFFKDWQSAAGVASA